MNKSKLSYRPEIDGLRAIAVGCVILYHAQFVLFDQIWFKGGFLGVDIFFVISGYLITRIILSELLTKGYLNFSRFYERRARRILPMLILIIYVSLPFAWLKLLPSDFVEYAESILTSLFFGSNVYFYYTTTEYGSGSALLKPLLHTWSLSVEEQFYLIFPITAYFVFKFFRQHFCIFLIVAFVSSLVFATVTETRATILNFYLPFSRIWELAAGALLAYKELFTPLKKGLSGKFLSTLGVTLVACSIFLFDEKTPHPGIFTLTPIIGASLIIGFSTSGDFVGRILASKPFVSIGLISYSAYLWHFPIFAFSRINANEPVNIEKVGLISIILLLSVLSYKFIELPCRNEKIIKKKLFAKIIIFPIIVLMFFAIITKELDGIQSRFSQGWKNFVLDGNILMSNFHDDFDFNETKLSLPSTEKINVYIFGNSHSIDFLSAMLSQNDFIKKYHFLKLYRSEQISCFDESDTRLSKYQKTLYASEAYQNSDIFIIATRFADVACDSGLNNNPTDADGLSYLIRRLQRDGKKIVILGNTLVLNQVNGNWIEEEIFFNAVKANIDFEDHTEFLRYKSYAEKEAFVLQSEFNLETNKRLRKFASENGLAYFDRSDLFCDNDTERCLVFTDDGHRIRYDYGHLTRAGKNIFGQLLKSAYFDQFLENIASEPFSTSSQFFPYDGSLHE